VVAGVAGVAAVVVSGVVGPHSPQVIGHNCGTPAREHCELVILELEHSALLTQAIVVVVEPQSPQVIGHNCGTPGKEHCELVILELEHIALLTQAIVAVVGTGGVVASGVVEPHIPQVIGHNCDTPG
jgi:methionine synthase I (cobalamin-dependent)